MKLLFDHNISFRIINKIVSNFPLAKHVSNVGLMDADDIDIWLYAQKENY
jgi:predicted nuclease of predicted toxin-antitoxin system